MTCVQDGGDQPAGAAANSKATKRGRDADEAAGRAKRIKKEGTCLFLYCTGFKGTSLTFLFLQRLACHSPTVQFAPSSTLRLLYR